MRWLGVVLCSVVLAGEQSAFIDTGKVRFSISKQTGTIRWVEFGGRRVISSESLPPERDLGAIQSRKRDAESSLLKRISSLKPDAPCTLSKGKTRHNHTELRLQNGVVFVRIVPEFGGRIIEFRSLALPDNLLRDAYSEAEKLDTSKRIYVGGWEDAIDRRDSAWMTAYKVKTEANQEAISVRLTADVPNTMANEKLLRIERTVRIQRGSPLLEVTVRHTPVDGTQKVRIMPHPDFTVGKAVSDNDWVFCTTRGQFFPARAKDNMGRDIYLDLDPERDHWGAIIDRDERLGIITTFHGPVRLLDIWTGREGMTFETYTSTEELKQGESMELRTYYYPAFNADRICFADESVALGATLASSRIGPGDKLILLLEGLRTGRKELPLEVRAELLTPAGHSVMEHKLGEFRPGWLVATHRQVELDVSKAPPGKYELAVKAGERTIRLPFEKVVPDAVFMQVFVPQSERKYPAFSAVGFYRPVVYRLGNLSWKGLTAESTGEFRSAGKTLAKTSLSVKTEKDSSRIQIAYRFEPADSRELLSSVGFTFLLALPEDLSKVRVWVKCEGREERWWLNPNPVLWHHNWMLSDKRERWPIWRLGGLLCDSPYTYFVWKANRADTSPVVVEKGKKAPGVFDISWEEHGLTILWEEMQEQAPSAVELDGSSGLFRIYLHPPQARPVPLSSFGKRDCRLTLAFHQDIFPVTHKMELSRKAYAELIRAVIEAGLFNDISYHFRVRRDGTTEHKIRWAVDAGFQPSDVMEIMTLGNAWRLARLCQQLKIHFNRGNIPETVRRVLDHFHQLDSGGK